MERSVISISILVLGCLVASAAAQSDSNANAYLKEYHAKEINWNMIEAHVSCATWDAHRSLEWRSKYNWAAFCGPDGPAGKEACGKCLNVIYTSTEGQETETATVRIVETCSSTTTTSLDLDKPVFDQLDIDKQGSVIGHLTVDYEFVDCGDTDTTIRFYSGQ